MACFFKYANDFVLLSLKSDSELFDVIYPLSNERINYYTGLYKTIYPLIYGNDFMYSRATRAVTNDCLSFVPHTWRKCSNTRL